MILINIMLMFHNHEQDGQPDGRELENGVAIHTLRMPMPYRCLPIHTNFWWMPDKFCKKI